MEEFQKEVLLSVIISVYNTPKDLLEHCMLSVLNNIRNIFEIEVLCIDDGSTFPYVEKMIKKYEKEDYRIKYIFKKNSGVSETRNLGIEMSKGKYITFIDGDDYLEGNALQHMIDTMRNYEADLVIFDYCKDNNYPEKNIRVEKKLSDSEIRNILLQKGLTLCHHKVHPYLPFARIFNRSLLDKHQIFFEPTLSIGEDALFNFYFISYASSIYVDNTLVYHYVTNSQSSTQKCSDKNLKQLPRQMDIWENFVLKRYPYDKEVWHMLCMRCLSEIRTARRQYFTNPKNRKEYKEKKKELNNFLSQPIIKKWIHEMKLSDASDIISFKNILLLKLNLYWLFLITERS